MGSSLSGSHAGDGNEYTYTVSMEEKQGKESDSIEGRVREIMTMCMANIILLRQQF